jgi:DNA-binding response OmpR family regulator
MRATTSPPLILVIEDDTTLGAILEVVLEDEGYAFARRERGRSGLAAARELRPAAVVLDLRLPDSWGQAVLRRLKADPETRAIPVVVVSGATGELGANDELFASAVLAKPVDLRELFGALRRAGVPSPRA